MTLKLLKVQSLQTQKKNFESIYFTVCCKSLRMCSFWLETMVIRKNESHSCYPIICAWFQWWWKKWGFVHPKFLFFWMYQLPINLCMDVAQPIWLSSCLKEGLSSYNKVLFNFGQPLQACIGWAASMHFASFFQIFVHCVLRAPKTSGSCSSPAPGSRSMFFKSKLSKESKNGFKTINCCRYPVMFFFSKNYFCHHKSSKNWMFWWFFNFYVNI